MPFKASIPDRFHEKFGRLTPVRRVNTRYWECVCDCGQRVVVSKYHLYYGTTRSCRCLQREQMTTHGQTNSPEYISWAAMIQRGLNTRTTEMVYQDVTVCTRWQDFSNFLADLGYKPTTKHSIDRYPDNSGNYSCGKCADCLEHGWSLNARWATWAEQNRNKRTNHMLTLNGETLCVEDWAKRLKVHPVTLLYRLKRNWTVEKTLTTPKQ